MRDTKPAEIDTETKIKEAAREIFQKKGFAAAKTREIAEAAGINLALLNYYFRSKRKLYTIIMTETMQSFFGSMIKILDEPSTSLEEKIEIFVNQYISLLSSNSNIPHFILNHVREEPNSYLEKMVPLERFKGSIFVQQFMQAAMAGKIPPLNPMHFMLNLVSLVVFPFLAQPMIMASSGIQKEQFLEIIEERRRLIPLWIETMLTVK